MMNITTVVAIAVGTFASSAAAEPAPRLISARASLNSASAPASTLLIEAGLGASYIGSRFDLSLEVVGTQADLVTGRRNGFALVPRFGAHFDLFSRRDAALQAYAAAQFSGQSRTGAELPQAYGAAIAGELGVRLLGCSKKERPRRSCVAVSLGLRVQTQVSDYQVGSVLLPAESTIISLPFTASYGLKL